MVVRIPTVSRWPPRVVCMDSEFPSPRTPVRDTQGLALSGHYARLFGPRLIISYSQLIYTCAYTCTHSHNYIQIHYVTHFRCQLPAQPLKLRNRKGSIKFRQGRVDDLPFFDYSSPFCFMLIEFNCIFFRYLLKYHFMFINIVFWLGCDRLSGLLYFVPALLFPILAPLFLPSSSVSFVIIAVPMCESLGKHSCMVPHFL